VVPGLVWPVLTSAEHGAGTRVNPLPLARDVGDGLHSCPLSKHPLCLLRCLRAHCLPNGERIFRASHGPKFLHENPVDLPFFEFHQPHALPQPGVKGDLDEITNLSRRGQVADEVHRAWVLFIESRRLCDERRQRARGNWKRIVLEQQTADEPNIPFASYVDDSIDDSAKDQLPPAQSVDLVRQCAFCGPVSFLSGGPKFAAQRSHGRFDRDQPCRYRFLGVPIGTQRFDYSSAGTIARRPTPGEYRRCRDERWGFKGNRDQPPKFWFKPLDLWVLEVHRHNAPLKGTAWTAEYRRKL